MLLSAVLAIVFSSPGSTNEPDIELMLFSSGFSNPVGIAHANDARLFVVEKAGVIRIVLPDGSVNLDPFLSISDRVRSSGGEQGLLGLAFHPDYQSNGRFFVNYTDASSATVVSEFQVSANPDIADPDSEAIVFTHPQPWDNHNGGDLRFGPDGYLYIAMGDGGSGGDPDNYAQNSQSLLGKILRFDMDTSGQYSIPPDNPFVNNPEFRDEIWALGLRNPWRISFDGETGDFWISDVGQSAREEINFQPASSAGGENYGWRCYEGNLPYNTQGCEPPEMYVFPVFDYGRNPHCSVTGGFVYRGSQFPDLFGRYFFGDYCSGNIWSLSPDGSGGFSETDYGMHVSFITSFGANAEGELFVVAMLEGNLHQIVQTGAPTPTPTPPPEDEELFVELDLSNDYFTQGDRFLLLYSITNPESQTVSGNFWLILDVYGSYWFYPGWTDIPDYSTIEMPSDTMIGPVTVLDFLWPSVEGHAAGLFFHAAVTTPANTDLRSNLVSLMFSY
jgi:glucose/arabinose dehydrogenase